METNELVSLLGSAVAAAKSPQEYCVAWTLTSWWLLCMTKGEWAAWMQGLGSILGLGVAIWLPWHDRRVKRNADRKKAVDESDLTIQFHSELFVTNEGMLSIAIAHLPGANGKTRPDAASQLAQAIRALRPLEYEHIRVIAGGHPELAKQLADFRCELHFLTGILDRNGGLETLDLLANRVIEKSTRDRLLRLDEIARKIRSLTVRGQ